MESLFVANTRNVLFSYLSHFSAFMADNYDIKNNVNLLNEHVTMVPRISGVQYIQKFYLKKIIITKIK